MSQQVIPFHISIEPRSSSGAYTVTATTRGAQTTTELELPDGLLALASRLLQPGVKLPISDAPALGRALGRALLAPPLRDLLLRSAKSIAQNQGRLQVQLQIAAPELAALPWEWVTIGVARPWSPALRDEYALVRSAQRAAIPAPAALAGPLRVLAVAGASEDLQLEALHTALAPVVQSGRIELRLLRGATPQSIERALENDSPHILHCAAPIGMTSHGVPQLMIGPGLSAFDLSALAARSRDLRLIVLAGSQGDATSVSAAPMLLAATLIGDDLPAAITFGAALPASLLARFAAACYRSLAEGAPVDLAATAGRRALSEHAGGRGWGFPQLRLMPSGEQIFVPSRARRAGRMLAGRARLAALGAGNVPRWAMFSAVAALLLALLLVGRSLGARGVMPMATVVAPRAERAAAQPTPTLGALQLATSVALPAMAPAALLATSVVTAEAPTAVPPTSYATYMTAAGDTLDSIAGRMGSSTPAIAELNHLDAQQPLRPERPLVIPVLRPGQGGAGGLIIDHGNKSKPQVALTFDIEIDDTTLYGILDILRARGLHGTFFVTGSWVQAFPDAARAIVRDGHEIGNHSFSHPFFSHIGLDGAAAELEETEKIIKETTGVTSRPYFRFPYGDSTPDVAAVVASEGYVAYHWSADDVGIPYWLDETAANPAGGNGAILLMHGRYSTIESLPEWVDRLIAMGLQPTSLGAVLK